MFISGMFSALCRVSLKSMKKTQFRKVHLLAAGLCLKAEMSVAGPSIWVHVYS